MVLQWSPHFFPAWCLGSISARRRSQTLLKAIGVHSRYWKDWRSSSEALWPSPDEAELSSYRKLVYRKCSSRNLNRPNPGDCRAMKKVAGMNDQKQVECANVQSVSEREGEH